MTDYTPEPGTEARARAVARLKKKTDFRNHLLAYLMFNGALVVVWALTGASFFWPAIPMLMWGIGVVFHAQDAYGHQEISEADIRREMQRMK